MYFASYQPDLLEIWDEQLIQHGEYIHQKRVGFIRDLLPIFQEYYETVSEGTPVSPKFATEQELLQWLINQGHTEKAAKKFIEDKWVMSGLLLGSRIYSNIDALDVD